MENKRNFKNTILRVLIGMLLVIFIIGGVILSYIYFIRRDTTTNKVVTTETINDNSISNEEAEQRNLDNVLQTPRDINTLSKDFNASISQDPDLDKFVIADAFEVTKDLKLNTTAYAESNKTNSDFAPIFYIKIEDAVNFAPDITALSSLILTEVNKFKFKIIYLDVSFTYVKDVNTLLANLKNSLKDKETKIGLYLYPRWGKDVDYKNFLQITNDYHQTQGLNEIVNRVDEVIIQLYGFSNEYSILPGNVAPPEWANKVVAFTAQQVTDKDKVFFEINSNFFVWPERQFSDQPVENYSVINTQAEVLSLKQLEAKGYKVNNTSGLGDTMEEMKSLELDGKKFISVSPTKNNNDELISIIASYGFPGYVVK